MADTETTVSSDDVNVEITNGETDPVAEAAALEKEETDAGTEEKTEVQDVEMEEKKEEDKPTPIEELVKGIVKISPVVINDMKIKEFITLLHRAESFSMDFDKKEGVLTLNFAPEKARLAWNIVRTIANLKLTNKELKVECPEKFAEVIANEKEGKKTPKKASKSKDESKSKSVKVSNIPTDTTEETLKTLFGDAEKITIEKDDEGKSKGTAVLAFASPEKATEFLATNKEVTIGENTVTMAKVVEAKVVDPFDELKKRWERWSGTGEGKKKKKKGKSGGQQQQQQQQGNKGQAALQRAKQARMNAIRMKQGRGMGNRFGMNRGGLMGPRQNMGPMGPGPMGPGPMNQQALMNQMEALASMMNMNTGGGMMGGGMGSGMMGQMGGMMQGGGMMKRGMMQGDGGMMSGGGMMQGGGSMRQEPLMSPRNRGVRQRQSSIGQDMYDDGMMQGGGGMRPAAMTSPRNLGMTRGRQQDMYDDGDYDFDTSVEDMKMRQLKERQYQHLQMKQERGMRGQGGRSMMSSGGGYGYDDDLPVRGNRLRRNSAPLFEDDMYQSGYNNRGGFEDEGDYMPQTMRGYQNVPGKRKPMWEDDFQGNQWGAGKKQKRGGGGGGGRAGSGGGRGGGGGGGRGGGGGMGGKKNQGRRQQGGGQSAWKSSEDMWSDFMTNQGASGNYGGYPY